MKVAEGVNVHFEAEIFEEPLALVEIFKTSQKSSLYQFLVMSNICSSEIILDNFEYPSIILILTNFIIRQWIKQFLKSISKF